MTLIEVINKLKNYAQSQFNSPKVMVGSVYENMNAKENLTYPVINFDNVNVIKRENEMIYSFYVYYADRLNEDGSNQLEIESQATTSLQLILRNIYDSGAIGLDEYYQALITPYKLKFTDVCAGAWMQINVHTPDNIDYCDAPSSIRTLYVTSNGLYDCENYEKVNVEVSGSSGSNIVEVTKEEYDAMVTAGTIDENTLYIISGYTDNYELGYASGWTDGYNEASEGAYQSGYTSGYTDGFQSGYTSGNTDGFQSGYTSGYTVGYDSGFTDGVESVPLTSITIDQNGIYLASEGGYNEINVNVPTGITPTAVTTFTDNGTYDVTSAATAIVNIDKEALFKSGYDSGYTDGVRVGYQSGYTVGYDSGFTSGHTSGYTEGYNEGYQSGKTDGAEIGYEQGFQSGYTSGYTDGEASVPLSTTGFTANGTYVASTGGWNEVTVNVPTITTQSLTQAEYDALTTKDPMVIYLITD